MTAHAGVPNVPNGNWFLRWWPVVLFLALQVASSTVITWRVGAVEDRLSIIENQMVRVDKLNDTLGIRDERLDALKASQNDLKERVLIIEKAVR